MKYMIPGVAERFRCQYGIITRAQATAGGLAPSQITRAIRSGAWERLRPGVYHLTGSPLTTHGWLLAACLATGGRASHESAAWLWDLLAHPPPRPTVSVRANTAGPRPGMVVHRIRDLTPLRAPTWQQIPCTDPVGTVIDLAGVVRGRRLDEAVDRGLSLRRFTIEGLALELDRRPRRGRPGAGLLRKSLYRRGFLGAPHPSVLESRVLRLLAAGGIEPWGVEVEVFGTGGRYRLDVRLAERLAMEVDGFAYHADPEAMTYDHRRRNELIGLGWTVLVFTWRDVTEDGERVLNTVRRALDPRTRAPRTDAPDPLTGAPQTDALDARAPQSHPHAPPSGRFSRSPGAATG